MQALRQATGIGNFGFMLANVPGWLDPGIAIAASRCGAIGILNAEGLADVSEIRGALDRVRHYGRGRFGLKIEAESRVATLLEGVTGLHTVVLVAGEATPKKLAAAVKLARSCAEQVFVEVTSEEQGSRVQSLAIDGVIAKGQEAGGAVGEETAFILLQRLLDRISLPVWVQGGVGLHSVAACYVAGAAGVVLDGQLLLLGDSALPPRVRSIIERGEGDETVILGRELGHRYRGYRRQRSTAFEALKELEGNLTEQATAEARSAWKNALAARANWRDPDASFLPLGQDGAFAAPLAARFSNVAALVNGLREAILSHVTAAQKSSPLSPGSTLARSHKTEYPILQGPMTRVSDTAAFAASVAEGGGLPFLALALLRGPQVKKLLLETQQAIPGHPWGVGILGFVPADLRAEQMAVVREIHPPFAIIAGGRPDQAAQIEKEGTVCYLHVPSPKLLEVFIRDGARRFIFEGLECGGHIGPRTSFVLWESMIEVVQRAIDGGIPAAEFHMVFAGGIHDARSAAMVAAMAGPLAEQGVAIGALMGTAYLFTHEAVEGGAIVETFQNEAKRCSKTVILETGPGHATRCADTPFYSAFLGAKRKLAAAKKSHDQVRDELEQLNLGRLRVASKGILREQGQNSEATYKNVSVSEQLSEGMYMIGQLAALRDQVVSIRELHQEVSGAGAHLLQSSTLGAEAPAEASEANPCDVAIVGMSCVLPKAPDVRTFWANMINKVDGISDIPGERFNIDLYYDADRKARDKIYSKWGGFIHGVPFEPLRYGIPPTALASIDPMQLLSLIVVDRALDDAGYRTREFPREKTSVIFGTSGGLGDLGGHYAIRSALASLVSDPPAELIDQLPEWTEDSFAGLLPNVAAGRVANRFNLGGVNFTVDAACASSMAAVYVAAKELTTRTSDMVIVGGVDTVQSPFCFLCFSKAQALSPRGRCRPFDESADGIAISEGITVLVMKRLADAERDGDRIYAVLKGVGGSSDGRGRSMTAPRREGQKLVMQRAYRQAGFSAATVGLMEAHGTGTVAGDATEMGSLSEVLLEAGAPEHGCAVGSVKSLVGHTKAAAGVTGVMRVALALYHKVVPPTLHVEKPNAKLSEPGSPLFVPSAAQPWLPPVRTPRRAGASSFGFGGTNFHAVLEEYLGEFRSAADRVSETWPAELLVWHAASPAVLETSLASLSGKLDAGAEPELHELAAAVCRRGALGTGNVHLAIVAASLDDLKAKIGKVRQTLAAGRDRLNETSIYLESGTAAPPPVAFLFPGQGSQSPDMLRDLAIYFPEFRASLELADQVLDGSLPQRLSNYIYPPTAYTPDAKKEQMRAITDTSVAQPALGAVEIALARLLDRLGVQPSMTAGHSYGEYVALCAAGVFSEETLFRLSEARGRAMKEANRTEPGSMVAAEASAEKLIAALGEMDRITVANYNSPRQTVLAGPVELLDGVVDRLKAARIGAVKLPVGCAFHSPLVQGARGTLAAALSQGAFAKPRVPVFSNTLGARYPEEPAEIAAILTDHVVRPVRFLDEVRAMYDGGARIFVEVGPKGVLSGLTRHILDGADAKSISIDANGRHGVTSLLEALAQLIVSGVQVDTAELFRGRSKAALNLEQLKPPVLDGAQWLVNGGRAFQRSRPPMPLRQVPLVRTIERVVEVEKIVEVEKRVEVPVPVPNAAPALAPQPASSAAPMEALLIPFQNLMSQFLQTQSAVMMAYLQGAPASPAISAPPLVASAPAVAMAAPVAEPPQPTSAPVAALLSARPAPPQVQPKAQPKPAAASPVPMPAPSAPAPAHEAVALDVLAEVVRIASERTGYPAEILDVNASIEADLGIDSIKRVEILSSVQQLFDKDRQARLQAVMDRLIAAPSLREIANVIIAALGVGASPAAAPVSASAPQAPAKPVAPARDVLAEVVRIASERTGYPAEILDVNASIEADLGIDSIKRVEILSSYQQLCSADEQATLQAVMDKLIAAPSLREIANVIIAALGVGASPAAAPVSASAPQAPAKPVAPARDVLAEVVRIASERTGYPAEILDVNASIEADLGIDSIKRVEILSSYQQLCTADEQATLQTVMDKLIAAPSLREIANVIVAALGVGASPAAALVSASAPQEPAKPVAPARDVLAEVVRIASERTGYPAEILDVNASIEADLGIDSIKRVEILGSYQQLCTADEQAKLQAVMDKLIAAPSLREIANVISAALGAADAAGPAASVPPSAEIPRFAFAAADCPRQGTPKHYAGRLSLITDDETGLAAGIAETWTRAGEKVVLVRHSLNGTLTTDQVVTGDLTDSATVKDLVQFVRARHGAIGALIHLLPLRIEAGDPRGNLKEWRDHLQQDIKSFYGLLRAAEKDIRQTGPAGGALIAVATGRAGVFGLQPEVATPPTHQGVADFTKTVALEFPEARGKIIDLDLSDPVGVLKEKLLEELNSTDDTLQVGLPGDRRLTALLRNAGLNAGPRLSIGSDWVFLITGGARGITAEIARLLAERHRPTLVIAGATPLPQAPEPAETAAIADKDRLKAVVLQRLRASGASVRPADVEAAVQRLLKEREIRGTLDALERTGARVEYHGVDVRDEAAFGAVIDGIYARHGRLDVVVHGAGIIEDKLIRDKAPESFDRVVHTKADSTYIIEKKLRPAGLQRLLLMSSITAAFGNRGQADYGAANGIMNGMALRLAAAWPGRVVSVNWGPWDQANMVPEHVRKQFAARGVEIIPLRAGAEAALQEIEAGAHSEAVVIRGGGPWGQDALPAAAAYFEAIGGTK